MRIEFAPTEVTPSKIDCLVYYSFAEVGDFLFFVLSEAELISEKAIGDQRQLDFGASKVIDAYVIRNPAQQHKDQMEDDFQRYLNKRGREKHPVGIGEIFAFSKSNMPRPKAA